MNEPQEPNPTQDDDPSEDERTERTDPQGDAPTADEGDDPDGEDVERVYTEPELRQRVEQAREEAQQKYLRVLAEYDNFRKRTGREKSQWMDEAVNDFVRDLLVVFDSFDRALAIETDDADAVREGLALTKRQLDAALEKNGIRALDPKGEPFDPNRHEALTRVPSTEYAEGIVTEVFEKGYLNGERLVRAARVVVSSGSPD